MKIYLIRHGDAVPETQDPSRPLSKEGVLNISEITAFLEIAGVRVEEIWHSTKLRARQTAELIASGIPHKKVIEREGITPNDPVQALSDELKVLGGDIMLVGHLPFLEKLVSHLITGRDHYNPVIFDQGEVVCMERDGERFSMIWMINPALLNSCIKREGTGQLRS